MCVQCVLWLESCNLDNMGNVPGQCIGRNRNRLSSYLTPAEKATLKSSLEFIKDDLHDLGVIVFVRFFETEPKLKHLFPKIVRVNEKNELELEMDGEMLRKHGHNVMHTLGAAIENMEESDFMNTVITAIGSTHVRRKVKGKMLYHLWPSMDYGLRDMLQERYTREVAAAWKKLFYYTVNQMRRGMKAHRNKTTYV
ncbi:cytoglobin-1-like isoform X2 [Argopecten irradians]|uniref:cytoglobin-1-like isoform X2 n=1 Tax=Argopecten irradians TaxID=31199 RepID=UPI0037216E02